MAETPETPTDGLADELERCGWALHLELPAAVAVDVQKLTDAAASQLRQLDRIKAALPLVDMIRRMVDACRNVQDQGRPKNVEWFDWVIADLERIADALEADDG